MRPHVEMVAQEDLRWHLAELPSGVGEARQRNLSYDEEDGSASTLVRFDTDWTRPAGFHRADTEWFILDGTVQLGDTRLTKWDYFRAPADLCVPAISVAAGTDVLLFRDFGDETFVEGDSPVETVKRGGNTMSDAPGELTITRGNGTSWIQNLYAGEAQSIMQLHLLYRDPSPENDPTKGWVTMLSMAPAGSKVHGLEHHDVFEESYCLSGGMTYTFGRMAPGRYFYRPAYIKHGDFFSDESGPRITLFRVGGDPINWMTEGCEVKQEGHAVNWGEANAPLLAGQPVRSRSCTEAWSWDGRTQKTS